MKSFFKLFALSIVGFGFFACGNAQKGIEFVSDEVQRKVDVLYNGKLFTSYIYPVDLDKPALYPIYTSNGTVITRGFPRDPRPYERVDHEHHVGAWLTFGDVNGIDFWGTSYAVPADRRPLYGSVRHQSIISTSNGLKQGELVATADWVDFYEKLF